MNNNPPKGTPINYIGEFSADQLFYVAPGQLALEVFIQDGSLRQSWWYRCPCGSGGVLDGHIVNSTSPVDITPSIICPGGCHYSIKNGVVA
jgi:hypothetical protein